MARQVINVGTVAGDRTGSKLRVAGQMVNDMTEELYALLSDTIDAGAVEYDAPTVEESIQLAISAAVSQGKTRVRVPAGMLPYTSTLIMFNPNIQMVHEGGDWNTFDSRAYGANSAAINSDAYIQALAGARTGGAPVGSAMYPSGQALAILEGSSFIIGDAAIDPTGDNQFYYVSDGNRRSARFDKALSGTLPADDGGGNRFLSCIRSTVSHDAIADTGYTTAGAIYDLRVSLGWLSAARGTVIGVKSNIQVKALDGGPATERSEPAAFLGIVNAWNASVNGGQNYWGFDMNVYGPANGQEGLLVGFSTMAVKYHATETIDSTHAGAWGQTIVTRPGGGGGVEDGKSALTSYPIEAGLAICGWSGVVATATDGTSASATVGYRKGLQIGGRASAWLGSTAKSKIERGIDISDHTVYGIFIGTRHASFAGAMALQASEAAVGREVRMEGVNTDNTNGASHSTFELRSGGSSGGDPYFAWRIAGIVQYLAGIDNSDGDNWKLETGGNSLGAGSNIVKASSTHFTVTPELRVIGDTSGVASANTLTGTSDLTANSSGVGTIKLKGTTSRDSSGFIKFYIGTTAYYVPVFSAIAG